MMMPVAHHAIVSTSSRVCRASVLERAQSRCCFRWGSDDVLTDESFVLKGTLNIERE